MSSPHQLGIALFHCCLREGKPAAGELFPTARLLSQRYPERDQHPTAAVLMIFYRECLVPVCLKSIHHASPHTHNVQPGHTHH